MGRGRILTRAGLIAVTFAFGAVPAFAQTTGAPNTSNLSFTTGLEFDTNKDLLVNPVGSTTSIYERLDFSGLTESSTQLFKFSFGTQLEYENYPGGTSFGLTDTALSFTYARTAANSQLSIDGDYWMGDISSAYNVNANPALIRPGVGQLLRTSTNLAFQTGLNDPIGFWVNAGYDTRNYSDIAGRGFVDSTTTVFDVGANFRFSKATTGTMALRWDDYVEQNRNSREVLTTDVTFGVSHELRSALVLNGQFGYRERETSNFAASVTESGYFLGVNFVQDRTNGTIFGGINYDGTRFLDEASISLGRSLALPDGSLSASVTLTDIESIGFKVLGYVDYVKQTPSGDFTFGISRDQNTDSRNRDVYYSTVGVAYRNQINSVSDFDLSLNLSRLENKYFGALPVEDRATFRASYTRAVTQDWFLNVGYQHREYTSSRTPSANSDTVFLTMTRDVQFGF